jgi:Trypsin-like peptidase domain
MTDEQLSAMSKQFAKRCETELGPSTVMLAIIRKSDLTPAAIIANGTGSLINTGARQLLVTNDHVYEAFQSRRAVSPDIMLLMSGVDGKPFHDISYDHSVRSRDKDLDLAVLDIPAPLVFKLGKKFSSWDSWPPRRPEEDMQVVVYGYPGQGRIPLDNSSLGICHSVIVKHVASVSSRHFVLANPDSDSVIRNPDGVAPLTSFGGMSGSAAYAITKERQLILAGFMYSSNDDMDIIFVTHADHIRSDGTIRECA